MGAIGARLVVLISQFVLGWLLGPDDFGLYAVAISIAVYSQMLHQGGVRTYLLQQGHARFTDVLGRSFGVAQALGTGVACVLLGVVLLLESTVEGDLVWVAIPLLLQLPLQPTAMVNQVRLQHALRFGVLARIEFASIAVQAASSVVFAALGLGALSISLGVFLATATELGAALWIARVLPWRHRVEFSRWTEIMRQTRWLLLGGIGLTIPKQGDYLALSVFATSAVVGVYYFAYQLTNQAVQLFGGSLSRVLVPSLVLLNDEPDRQAAAVNRAGSVLAVVGAPALISLVPAFEHVEEALWGGKWSAAVSVFQVLAATLPLHLLLFIPDALLQARGLFRFWAIEGLLRGSGVPLVVIAAGVLGSSGLPLATQVALLVGGYRAVTGVMYVVIAGRRLRISSGSFLTGWLRPLTAAYVACAVMLWLPTGTTSPWVVSVVLWAGFLVLYIAVARVTFPRQLAEVLTDAASLPGATRVQTLLRLPVPAASGE